MKQVRIRVTCDACAAWHGNAENDTDVGTVQASASQTLDLCGAHRADLAPLLALIAEWGVTPERKGTSKRRWVTPTEAEASNGTTARTSAPVAPAQAVKAPNRRGGARARQRRANAAPTVELEITCPLCAAPSATPDALVHHVKRMHQTTPSALYGGTCPVCGHEGTARGLGVHAGKAHQVEGAALLFAMAEQQGDPHGVLAARAQAVASMV